MNRPVNNKVLQEIIEKTNSSTGMFVQRVYKGILRNLINIFGNTHYIDRDNNSIKVKCFHANQERAVAKSTIGDNITLPVITVSENNTSNNDDRRRYNPILIHDKYWNKRKNRAIRTLSMSPRPVDIKYTVNIWSKYKEDLDQIREYIFTLFNPDLEVKTKNSEIIKAFIENESDIQQNEANDQQDRILKKSITITVETYIENPKFLYTSTGKIERVNFEIKLENTNITETVTTAAAAESHAQDCFCEECVLPLYLITADTYNFAAECAIATGHSTGCQCAQCTLIISLIDGNNFNLPIDCSTLNSIDELE
jgi:hypothetical protein